MEQLSVEKDPKPLGVDYKPTTFAVRGIFPKNNSSSCSVLQGRLPFRIDQNLIPLITKNFLEYEGKELYCPLCEAHLKDQISLVNHTKSKRHSKALKIFTDQIAKENKKSSVDSRQAKAKNSALNIDDKELPQSSKNTVKKSKNVKSKLFPIKKNLFPLIGQHSLQHLKNEIYCVPCDAHLMSSRSLIEHTASKHHVAKLDIHRASKKQQNKNSPVNSKAETDKYLSVDTTNVKSPKTTCTLTKDVKISTSDAQEKLQILKNVIKPKMPSDLSAGDKSVSKNKKLENSQFKSITTNVKPKNINKAKTVATNSKTSNNSQESCQNELKNHKTKQKKIKKQSVKVKKNRSFDPTYLKINMQQIYKISPDKLRLIKLSCELCFPKTSDTLYCLICGKNMANKLQTFYEHIQSSMHTIYLADTERNDRYFLDYPDQFSDLALAKEFMQEITEESIQCFTCNSFVKNDNVVIFEHIKNHSHVQTKQLLKEKMKKFLQDILVQMESTWYNTYKYWCQPCGVNFNAEFLFAKHMDSKKHDKNLKKKNFIKQKLVYDTCTSCAVLWLGVPGFYTQHCQDPMHKYLVHTGDFSKCLLPNQAKALLKKAEAEVSELINLSNQVLSVQKIKTDYLLKCLEDTVKCRFPNAKAYPFGSRVSGLGFPESDIDIFLDCGTYDGNIQTEHYQLEIIKSVKYCLYENQQLWEIDEILISSRTPIIKLRHRETEFNCDVSFKNGLSVENTKLLKCYIDNYPPCRKMMLFIKKWLSLCNLSGSQLITNYAICWFTIFYLQTESILPSVADLIAKQNKSKVIDNWESGICEKFDTDKQNITLTKLLHGFFVFYFHFDFRSSVACPIIGRTISKQDFTELTLLPKEMAPYINYVTKNGVDGSVELFRIDSEMCIQDPYDLSHNLTKAVRKFTLNRFRRLCAASAEILSNYIKH